MRQSASGLDAAGRPSFTFNKPPPEEQERILAKKRHRERNHPERIVERIIAAYAAEEGRTAEDSLMEIQGCGIFDLLVNGIKTRKDAASATQIVDAQAKFYERIGPKVIRSSSAAARVRRSRRETPKSSSDKWYNRGMEPTCKYPLDLLYQFEFHNYGHAMEILADSFPQEWGDIRKALESLKITTAELKQSGGNETEIPKKFDSVLYPLGWKEIKITGDLLVKIFPRKGKKGRFDSNPNEQKLIEGWIDGHNIDFVKGKVAFDLEWNSKDQTFDRDLLAMRTYFDCGIIDVGIIVTRAEELNDIFKSLGIQAKYGASTTWMGKLLPRLDSRRNGGCPILAIGIRKKCVVDWKGKNEQQG